ncbi:hypothetical protein U1Q18_013533 [Sarracenia purpurea var. burkii]
MLLGAATSCDSLAVATSCGLLVAASNNEVLLLLVFLMLYLKVGYVGGLLSPSKVAVMCCHGVFGLCSRAFMYFVGDVGVAVMGCCRFCQGAAKLTLGAIPVVPF